MSQQENDNTKKDLPNQNLSESGSSSGENLNNLDRVDEQEENTDESAFSQPMDSSLDAASKKKEQEENRLENAMLDETNSQAGRSEKDQKEKEYSDAQKEDSPQQANDNISESSEQKEDGPHQANNTPSEPSEEKEDRSIPAKENAINSSEEKEHKDQQPEQKNSQQDQNSAKAEATVLAVEEKDSTSEEQKIREGENSKQNSDEDNDDERSNPSAKKNAQSEFEDSVAQDSEDETSKERHGIEMKDYHSMAKEQLVAELELLVKNEKIQAIKDHVEEIKHEFNAKFDEELEEKKEEFLADGGNIIDFHYSTPLKKQFNSVYFDYKEKRNNYYQQLKQDLNKNLSRRLEIIEELKGLLDVEENINTTYKHFKDLQDRWKTAGPIPRDKYNTVWNTYHHHVENFYDFLHLNREFRDMDFKHNLEQKLKVIDRAEELTQEQDTSRAFRELQMLHKMWKEELGPVAKEYREDIWTRFSEATKKIHDLRQTYYDQLDQQFEKNLEIKQEINEKLKVLAETNYNSHNQWQQKIKELEALRDQFFKAGKVPREKNEETWGAFKQNVRQFNRNKNNYYKSLKKEQYENLEKKKDLIKIADENKDSDDFKATTPLMKKIQADWKKIGHVPRKDSDKVWKEFKAACNHYFDRLHKAGNEENTEEAKAFDQKKEILDRLKSTEFTGEKKTDLPKIKQAIEEWKHLGKVPYNKRFIEGKFNKLLDQLFSKLDVDTTKAEMMKYENKIQALNDADDDKKLRNEHYFLSKKVEETKAEIRQLENNLQFFSNVDDDNPLVKEVHKNIQEHKDQLEVWKEKLEKIKSLY